MKFKFFKADFTTTIEEIKRQYRKLAIKHHPDMGGKLEDMQQVNAEWEYLRKHNFNIHESAEGSTYTDWSQDAPDDVTNRFAAIIEQLIKLDGLTVEICGSFIWVGGNTKPNKEQLKGMGFRWAHRKKLWYLAPKNWKKRGRRELEMGEIRSRFGSVVVEQPQRGALTA